MGSKASVGTTQNSKNSENNGLLDNDEELKKCIDSLAYTLKYKGQKAAQELLQKLHQECIDHGVDPDLPINTPYQNTIPRDQEPEYPGDMEIEKKIKSIIRWNALAMVVKANREQDGIGGHISSFASSATLYEVGQNHFFKGYKEGQTGDQIYFQGHVSPGMYSRAYVEGLLEAKQLHNFRQELAPEGGLSSYPHPYLMPDFWQFPTVSMGLGPIMSIYQARFNRYLLHRGLIKEENSTVWCYIGDGETDEPETLGAINLAAREKLDNLIFVINCNLQRLDGPVRGNGQIIQDLEGVFKGAGWHVVKLIWGGNWDELFESEHKDVLLKRLHEVVDGDHQKYSVEKGSYIRKHFFSKYPELLEMISHLTDKDLEKLLRGGHDPKKVYAAYKKAIDYKDGPTVVLAKTIKGYGLGEAGEGKNISHQQKKMNERELREFRTRFEIPIDEDDVVDTPFYRPDKNSPEMKYIQKRRKEMGTMLPHRRKGTETLKTPDLKFFEQFLKGSDGREQSTTMAFVRILSKLLGEKEIGKRIVPIIPDEARTFGMEPLFRQIGIYSSVGQLYEPVDSETLLYYKEAKDGQILEEGINEAGSMSSFIAAGTSYSVHDYAMIPFFIYYSMFGFQRIGDLIWLAGDIRAKGFLLGGTAGRTTLNGEGLQHQDGHSLLLASTIPTLLAYDVAYGFEIAVIVQDGLKRMYKDNENIFYYMVLGNENYEMPEMPKGVEEGILRGLYKFKKGPAKKKHQAHIFGSGSLMNEALKAQEILAKDYDVSADVWGATSYKRLRNEALNAERWNRLNPDKTPKQSYVEKVLEKEKGVFVAVSDNMKIISDQINKWVPGGLYSLGTDGFGRSETRENLRKFFEVNAQFIVLETLTALCDKGKVKKEVLKKAIKDLKVDVKKPFPEII